VKNTGDMDVSVIIVNYNTCEITNNCLKSIIDQTKEVRYEVIVIDNCSSDGSVEMIKQEFPQFILIENMDNLGFGRANNLGIRNARGKYLFILNSDTILLNNAILFFFNFMEEQSGLGRIGAIGGMLLNKDLKYNLSFGNFYSMRSVLVASVMKYFKKIFRSQTKGGEVFIFENACYFEVNVIIGADLFVRKDVMLSLGGFDEDFFMYCEEMDLQLRMARRNLKRYIINGPKIIHLDGGSSNNLYKKDLIFTNGLLLYFRKHSPPVKYVTFRVSYLILKLPVLFNFNVPWKQKFSYVKGLFAGTKHFNKYS